MRKPTAAVLVAIAAVTLAAGAAAGPDAAKQRVAIQGHGAVFELKPLTSGDIKSDAGAASFCCWTVRTVVRDGQKVDITKGPEMTLVGSRGTLIARNRMEWLDVPGGYALFTGTWTFIRGTGDYAGLTGGGGVAGITLPGGDTKWRREGVLGPK